MRLVSAVKRFGGCVWFSTTAPGRAWDRLAAYHGGMFNAGIIATRRRPLVMGILNVTPDSFSDGGAHAEPAAAVRRAETMLAEGADLLDIGPESTRPGAQPVPAGEQIRRALPVIERIRAAHPDVVLSLDTRSYEVARAGLDAGVDIINDISALRDEPELAGLIAERGAGVVLMHMQGTPETMQRDPQYHDVVAEVAAFLAVRAKAAESAGIVPERIILDPGIGFGKTVAHNLQLLARLETFVELGYPALLGASRKGFIGKVSRAGRADAATDSGKAANRLGGSLACAARAYAAGAAFVRVHDVAATVQMLDVLAAIADA